MHLFLLTMMILQMDSVQIIGETETYKPLGFNVTVLPDGNIYLINGEKQVVHLNPAGEKVGRFGGAGQGPGEFLIPAYIGYQDGKIWVFDIMKHAVSYFSLDGAFLHVHGSENVTATLAKTKTGWAFCDFVPNDPTSARIVLADEHLGKFSVPLEWTPEWNHPKKIARKLEKRVSLNPVREFIGMAAGPNGRFLFVAHPGTRFRISVIDTLKKKLSHVIRRDDKPISFNEDWGEDFIKRNRKNSEAAFRVSLEAPKYFPIIRGITISPDGLLIVNKWTWDPDQKTNYLVLDRFGKEAHLKYRPENQGRVIAIHGGTAYLRGYDDETGQALILRCPIGSVDEVAMAYPIVYTPKKGMWIPIK